MAKNDVKDYDKDGIKGHDDDQHDVDLDKEDERQFNERQRAARYMDDRDSQMYRDMNGDNTGSDNNQSSGSGRSVNDNSSDNSQDNSPQTDKSGNTFAAGTRGMAQQGLPVDAKQQVPSALDHAGGTDASYLVPHAENQADGKALSGSSGSAGGSKNKQSGDESEKKKKRQKVGWLFAGNHVMKKSKMNHAFNKSTGVNHSGRSTQATLDKIKSEFSNKNASPSHLKQKQSDAELSM